MRSSALNKRGAKKNSEISRLRTPEDAELKKFEPGYLLPGSLAPVRRLVLVLEAADPPAHTSWRRIMSNNQISSVDVVLSWFYGLALGPERFEHFTRYCYSLC